MDGAAKASRVPRRAVAAALLVLVGVAMASTLRPVERAGRAKLLARSLAGGQIAPAERTGFWFDPEYAVFLADVARRTPRNATVAVLAPSRPDVYAYQAAYQLAPRRVVSADRVEEAAFVAAYGHRGGGGAKATAVANGTLFRR